MMMNSKLAHRLVSAVAVGALTLGAVACGGAEEEEQRTETPTKTAEKRTTTPTRTVTETVTETETMKTK